MEMSATKPKLLLADDSVTIRKVVEMTFAEENIEVFTANDGESAMLKFIETQPDIVLAHIGLPETNGYQLCEMIKQDETTRHIPVLLLAGSFEPFDEAEAARVSADGFLTKPFASVREVVARVNDLLGHATLPAAVPEDEDIDSLYKSSFGRAAEIDEFKTVDDSFGEQQFDDEMIETSSPVATIPENNAADLSAANDAEHSREFDWSPAAVVTQNEAVAITNDTIEPVTTGIEQNVTAESGDAGLATSATVAPVESSSQVEEVEPSTPELRSTEPEIAEPSPEFIELVAQRVIEKLSDKTVREIAQETVPRIAEKLMREALGQDKKE